MGGSTPKAPVERLEASRLHWAIGLAPPHHFGAGRFFDDELVIGRAPGMLARANHKRAEMGQTPFATTDGFLV